MKPMQMPSGMEKGGKVPSGGEAMEKPPGGGEAKRSGRFGKAITALKKQHEC